MGGGGGLTFITACLGPYTDPASGACSNASNPASLRCALGSGDNCGPCPTGALCPGGRVQWPRPGFQLTASGTVAPCDFPPSRCASFDPGNVRLVCGPGYKQGTQGCSGCAVSFYQIPSGACVACPATDISSSVIAPLGFLALGFLGLYAALVVLAWRVSSRHGGTLVDALKKCLQLLVWIWQALQLMVSSARAASTAAPPWLQGLFSVLLTLQFEGVTLNPSCFSYVPFLTQWIIFGVYVCCLLLVAAYLCAEQLSSCTGPRQGAAQGQRQLLEPALLGRLHASAGKALTIVCLLYATTITAATQVTICMPVQASVRSYLALKQSGAQLVSAPSLAAWWGLLNEPGAVDVLSSYSIGMVPLQALPEALQASSADLLAAPLSFRVLATNPFLVCAEGIHVLINAVAISVLVSLCLLPPLSFAAVRLALLARMGDAEVVGRATAERWVGGLRKHWLPLPSALKAVVTGASQGAASVSLALSSLKAATRADPGAPPPPASAADSSAAAAAEAAASKARVQALEEEAAALLDATPQAYDSPAAPLLHPWTVGDRRPSAFYFKSLDQVVLFTLAIPTAFNASRTVGAASLPYEQALALQVSLLLVVVGAMALSARMALGVGIFPAADAWKRNALLSVFALTALAGVLNFVGWVRDVGIGSSVEELLLGLSVALFAGTVVLLCYLVWSFFSALDASCKGDAERAKVAALAAAGAVAPAPAAPAWGFSVDNPLHRGRRGGALDSASSSSSLASTARQMPLGRQHRALQGQGLTQG